MSADRARCELLSKLTTMKDYVDLNYPNISEKGAYQAHNALDAIWPYIDRRKGAK